MAAYGCMAKVRVCRLGLRLRLFTRSVWQRCWGGVCSNCGAIQGGPKSKPLPNYQKIVFNRIKASQWD